MKSFLSISKNNTITSIAIGKFDGVHLGHQKLLTRLSSNGAVIVIDTKPKEFLTSLQDKEAKLQNPYCLELESIKNLSGKEFVDFLVDLLPNLDTIIVGYDFRFGLNRAFGAYDMKQFFGGEVFVIPQVKYNDVPLHSSVIKDLILHGDMGITNAMLGWHYKIAGEVMAGQGLAKKELFATINIRVEGYIIPCSGVYATLIDGKYAVSFIGNRLSTDKAFAIESHIIDENITNPPKMLEITFIKKIRDNRYFAQLDLLKAQIQQDIQEAKKILQA